MNATYHKCVSCNRNRVAYQIEMSDRDARQGVYCPACEIRWEVEPLVRVATVKQTRQLDKAVDNV